MALTWTDDLGVSDDPDRFDEALAAFRRRVPMSESEWKELDTEERERAFKVANVAEASLVQEVFDALASAIEKGTTLEDFKAEVGAQLGESWGEESPSRIETIFRTNVLGAYNQGRYEILSKPDAKEARPFWRYDLIDDDALCPICGDYEGTILPADDPWWDEHLPPNHPNCRCSFVALTDDEADAEGVTTEEPTAEPAEGFGGAPSTGDWEPDASAYDSAISGELERKLG